MTILFLEAPHQIASKEAQNNEFIIETVVKACSDDLTIFLFGELSHIERYIPSIYLSLWDFCLLYKKMDLDPTVIPIFSNNYEFALSKDFENCYVLDSFNQCIIDDINCLREERQFSPITIQTVHCSIWDDNVIPLDWYSSQHHSVTTACVGGTFDCLHPGHRILLTLASLICDKLVIGLTTDQMLQKKEHHERIKPYAEREQIVLDFLHQIKPSLQVEIHPLVDIYGPSVLLPEIEGIVVSLETIAGAKMINRVRQEKGMKPLRIFTVNRGSKYNLSSSFIRQQNQSLVCNKHPIILTSVWESHLYPPAPLQAPLQAPSRAPQSLPLPPPLA